MPQGFLCLNKKALMVFCSNITSDPKFTDFSRNCLCERRFGKCTKATVVKALGKHEYAEWVFQNVFFFYGHIKKTAVWLLNNNPKQHFTWKLILLLIPTVMCSSSPWFCSQLSISECELDVIVTYFHWQSFVFFWSNSLQRAQQPFSTLTDAELPSIFDTMLSWCVSVLIISSINQWRDSSFHIHATNSWMLGVISLQERSLCLIKLSDVWNSWLCVQ